MSNLDSDAFLDCLLNYASAASGAVKSARHAVALKPAAMETVGFTVCIRRSVFDDSEPAEKERGEEKRREGSGKDWEKRVRGTAFLTACQVEERPKER